MECQYGEVIYTKFEVFTDTVADSYNIPGLCALSYTLSPQTDATKFGVKIGGNSIVCFPTNQLLIGISSTLTLSAYSAVILQETSSQMVSFKVHVTDPCLKTVISFVPSTSEDLAVTYTLTQAP